MHAVMAEAYEDENIQGPPANLYKVLYKTLYKISYVLYKVSYDLYKILYAL